MMNNVEIAAVCTTATSVFYLQTVAIKVNRACAGQCRFYEDEDQFLRLGSVFQ